MTTSVHRSALLGSDNTAGVDPAVLAAIAAANVGHCPAYGRDPWTEAAAEQIAARIGGEVEVGFVFGGTGANVVGLHPLLRPWHSVLTPAGAHLETHECGALERMTGSKTVPIATEHGKLTPESIAPLLWTRDDHQYATARVVSISQTTEYGTVYTPAELSALADFAHENGMLLHVDGARLANALAALGVGLREVLRDTGVDVATIGGTKIGMMFGEAVAFLTPDAADGWRAARKGAAQLPSKGRFVGAQFSALLTDDRWIANGRRANAAAGRLAAAVTALPGVELVHPVEANAVFARLPRKALKRLLAETTFAVWDPTRDVVRWMTSFDTTDAEVDWFADRVRAALDG
ncbi:low specificity L-threonine aldolase [Mycobacterium sp. NAZ190054]|uniref:threonine aldolase family protein n=1 Tax=Mycobacterium sp. NAZ190054 TaxID=1747766 RepID=UPI0007983959|nr:beta-eliminating lyase-related protein [Mycobacterium sp. NAZ190054]KWX66160.1 hypothetical protein ASJ79_26480 [Mycobacterium sp. NAZ190054]